MSIAAAAAAAPSPPLNLTEAVTVARRAHAEAIAAAATARDSAAEAGRALAEVQQRRQALIASGTAADEALRQSRTDLDLAQDRADMATARARLAQQEAEQAEVDSFRARALEIAGQHETASRAVVQAAEAIDTAWKALADAITSFEEAKEARRAPIVSGHQLNQEIAYSANVNRTLAGLPPHDKPGLRLSLPVLPRVEASFVVGREPIPAASWGGKVRSILEVWD